MQSNHLYFASADNYNFGDCLVAAAIECPEKVAFIFQEGAARKSITYRELHLRALNLSVELAKKVSVGDRALLVYPPGLDYIIGFMGCLYAGVIAVPVYPPATGNAAQKLRTIVDDCSPAIILTDSTTNRRLSQLKYAGMVVNIPIAGQFVSSLMRVSSSELDTMNSSLALSVPFLATDELPFYEERLLGKSIARNHQDTVAFLQYTSGSTGNPKGVMVSHNNLRHSTSQYGTKFSMAGKRMVYWLPPYHDLGLIGGILTPMYYQCETYLFSPIEFLTNPLKWIIALSEFKANISAAPNFAYGLVVKRYDEKKLAGLDLSAIDLLLVGAEPVRSQTIQQFIETYTKYGLNESNIIPGYGIAEGTLIITGRRKSDPLLRLNLLKSAYSTGNILNAEHSEEGVPVVGCGPAFDGHEVIIVDPETLCKTNDNQVGEIWIKSDSVGKGYWLKPELTVETFQALTQDGDGPFLRTGDLGFFYQEQLFISSRLKDLIIIAGRNYYPQDIETIIDQAHEQIRPGCSVAISVESEDTEALVLLVELRERNKGYASEVYQGIAQAITRRVLEHCGLMPAQVMLLPAKALDKTTSGKVRRQPNKQRYLQDKFSSSYLYSWEAPNTGSLENKSPKVCIIGGGPAGLMAALELRDKGYDKITVFEMNKDPGGKSLGVLHPETNNYVFHGIYAMNTYAYKNMLQLAKRYSIELIDPQLPENVVRSISPENGSTAKSQQKELTDFIDKYEYFRKKIIEDYGHILSPNFCDSIEDLWMPFSEWLLKHDWKFDIAKDFGLALVAPGYGYDLPAYYALLGVVSIPLDNWRLVRENGFLNLWKSISDDLKCVQFNTRIEKVTRKENAIYVETATGNSEYQQLVIACDLKEASKFLDITDTEEALCKELQHTDYCVAIAKIENASTDLKSLSENQVTHRVGHPVLMSVLNKSEQTYQVLYYGVEDSQQLEYIQQDLNATWVREIKRWKYFPHFGAESLKKGSLGYLRKLQGENNTYYVGSTLMFETTEHTVSYSKYLIDTHFPSFLPQKEMVMLTDRSVEEIRPLTTEQALERLRQIIAEHLHIPEDSIQSSSLSEIGLSSVMVVGVHNSLLRAFGFEFSLSLMFESENIQSLAEKIADLSTTLPSKVNAEHLQFGSSGIDPCMISFSVHKEKPPIFLIHDASLFALHYRKLLPSPQQSPHFCSPKKSVQNPFCCSKFSKFFIRFSCSS